MELNYLNFEKGENTPLKRVGKSQREISDVSRRSKTVICDYLKSLNKYGTRKPTCLPEKLSPQFMLLAVLEQLEDI